MEIIEISVPYTGTNFLAKLFTDRGFHRVGMNEITPMPDVLRVAHCIKPTQVDPALRLVKSGLPLVLPCRHPYRVEESYTRKGDSGHIDQMLIAFENLIEKFAPLTDLFLCVDSDLREEQFAKIRDEIGVPIKTDWPVIGSKSTTWRMGIEDFTPSQEVKELVSKNEEFFSRFYELV